MNPLFIGLDVGTQGVRALAVDPTGEVHAAAQAPFPGRAGNLPPGWVENDPQDWWKATKSCLQALVTGLKTAGFSPDQVLTLAVDSTSGTILPVDRRGFPLHPALMYNDSRSASCLEDVRTAGEALEKKLGYAFNSSFALPKILWLCRNDPALLGKTACFIHATDYIVGCLSGDFSQTDHSNALKTGFDLIEYHWPDFIPDSLGLPLEKLPRVLPPGEPLGSISPEAAQETGLSTGTRLAAGMTDGTAAQLASGAVETGSWNSILGTTLVLKGISRELLKDPLGRFYSHLHPQGAWMPGGASNTGAEWIVRQFPDQDPAALDAAASPYLPTGLVSYPLARTGERFPFLAPEATGFMEGDPADPLQAYAANLEGLACLERLAYEALAEAGAEVRGPIYVTGGGARSELWLTIRASVLNRPLRRPEIPETAMGAALLAASRTAYPNLNAAAAAMVRISTQVDPDPDWLAAYESHYQAFKQSCRRRDYLP